MNAQMKKGIVELCIMKLLDDRKASTFEILKQIEDLDVNKNTVYPILRRLNNDGLLICEKGNNAIGAPRKYYSLSDEGKEKLTSLLEAWRSFTASVNHILKEDHS
jgi:PadR family transcriptional regulator PadR